MKLSLPDNPLIDTGEIAADVGSTVERAVAFVAEDGAEWTLGVAIVAGVFLGLRLLRAVLSGLVGRKSKPPTTVRNIVASLISATSSLFLLLVAVMLVLPFFVVLTEQQTEWLQTAWMIVGTLQVAFWVRVVARAFIERIVAKEGDESTLANAVTLIMVFLNVIVFAIALVVILDNLGIDITGLVAGLGVGGIAIGLAAQSLFEDLFAGLSIILDKPFVRGDFVTFGTQSGVVERVGLKSTRIKTLSGQQLVVNNSKLLGNEINNFKRMAERRVVTRIGVTYSTPHRKLEALPSQVRAIVEATPDVRFDRCHLAAYGDFAILYELVFYVLDRDYTKYMDVQERIFLGIHALFERERIDFAFPTQTIHVGSVPRGAEASMAAE
jgi:small-conductance mechanosensitive channel